MPNSDAPDWDLEQLEVILEEPTRWQLVIAGPGAGKSAVACQRLAFLVDEGLPPARMLLVSFTRTAVAELRDRISLYAVAGERAKAVRVSTIDSHAWRLRAGFEDEPISTGFGNGSYDLSINQALELLRERQPDLTSFIGRLEHLILDEAQDVVGVRAEFVLELLNNLSDTCGVTILADPAQAIYGFTSDTNDRLGGDVSLISRLEEGCSRRLLRRELREIHRIKNGSLLDLFVNTRKVIETAETPEGHTNRVQEVIRATCGKNIGATSYTDIADFLGDVGDDSMLVLFRRRADVLFASSYCSGADVRHRLRMADLPLVVRPWIGWLFGEYQDAFITQERFVELWAARATVAPEPLQGEERDANWNLLHRLAAGRRAGTIDLVQLRRLVSRARPPVEICFPDLGQAGPILGTIHGSKGREEDTVVLAMPRSRVPNGAAGERQDDARVFEEGRVYYVGATRARKMLITAATGATRVGYLDSGRIYRRLESNRVQLEIGREGDVDRLAHLGWSTRVTAQRTLAASVGRVLPAHAETSAETSFARRILLEQTGTDNIKRFIEVGQFGENLQADIGKLWSMVDPDGTLKPPPQIRHIHLVAVSTVGLSESEMDAARLPFNRTGFALAPVVKGFPMIPFFYRGSRKNMRYT